MKATIVLVSLTALAIAALAAQPVTRTTAHLAPWGYAGDPAWMVLSGAVLLVVASMIRRESVDGK